MSEPVVSVVMPAFNAGRFIADAIESVQDQTFDDLEIIVVDDGSTDNTREIVGRLEAEDRRIRLLSNRHPKGAAGSRNTAFDAARGRWLAFLDSDDLWLPDKLTRQLQFAQQNDAAFVYGAFRRMSEDGQKVGRLITVPERIDYRGLLRDTCIATVTVMIDRHRVGAFHMPNLKRCNDFATWLLVLERCSIAYGLNEDLGRYRTVQGSLSSRKLTSLNWVWKVYRDVAGLSLPAASYCFSQYALKAVVKRVGF